jgi:hypothetical protein
MNTQHQMEEQLWSYIDGTVSEEEKSFIHQLVATNAEWKDKYHELLEVHDLLNNNLELDEPSMRFTQNVMDAIGKFQIAPAAKNYINKKIIWGIGLFFITMIIGFLIYGFGQVNWAEGGSTSYSIDFSKIEWNKFFNNTYTSVFMMINAVLGLVLLDMYLSKRKRKLQETNTQ